MHNGQSDMLDDIVAFDREPPTKPAPEHFATARHLQGIAHAAADVAPLAAFLKSLNEDYQEDKQGGDHCVPLRRVGISGRTDAVRRVLECRGEMAWF